MTGPEHFLKAEQLAAKAAEYLGQGDGQESAAVWAAVAQVHATLALAAPRVPDSGEGPTPIPEGTSTPKLFEMGRATRHGDYG
jgi:hypothetical protein